jgi:hypothetical protein
MTTIRHSLQHGLSSDSPLDLASLHDGLRLDFTQACAAFAEARRHQQAKDTPAHRSAILDGRARIDAILDSYVDLHAGEHS